MQIKYKRESDGATHVITCNKYDIIKQIIQYPDPIVDYSRAHSTKRYPKVITIMTMAPTKLKVYQQASKIELKLARSLHSSQVKIVHTFHDVYYQKNIYLPKNFKRQWILERTVCIYSIEK